MNLMGMRLNISEFMIWAGIVLIVMSSSNIRSQGAIQPCPEEIVSSGDFVFVEQMPKFPGGTDSLYSFVAHNLQYPDSCRNEGVMGNVIVKFIVDTTGCLTNLQVVRAPEENCGLKEEAMRVIRKMNELQPRWSPGSQDGKKVAVSFIFPLKFVLN